MVTEIKTLQKFQETISKDELAVVDFWATWCGPCRMVAPTYEKLSTEAEGISFYKVDVDEVPDAAQEAGVRAMPTFIVFKNGQKLDSLQGANPAGLKQLIAKQEGVTLAQE